MEKKTAILITLIALVFSGCMEKESADGFKTVINTDKGPKTVEFAQTKDSIYLFVNDTLYISFPGGHSLEGKICCCTDTFNITYTYKP